MAYTRLKADRGETKTVPFTASADRSAGDVIVVNQKLGVVLDDVTSGNDGLMIVGVPPPGINLPKKAEAFAHLDEVYWDVSAGAFTGTAADGTHVGYAYLASGAPGGASGDADVRVVLHDALNHAVT